MIEPENELVQIGLQVLSRHSVIDPDDRSFEQAPEVLHSHRMNVPIHKRLGMADGLMLSTASSFLVALEFIGDEQFSTDANKGVKEWGERIGFEVLDDLGCDVTASLLEPHYNLFAGSATTTLSAGLLPADVSVVSLNDTAELVLEVVAGFHCLSDLHTYTPGCFVGDSKGSLKLLGADSLLVVAHEPDGGKPLLKGRVTTMENGAGGDGELIGTVAATPYLAGGNPVGLRSVATWTGNAFGPALGAKEDLAFVLGREPFLKLDNVHGSSFWNHYSTIEPVCQGDKANHKNSLVHSFLLTKSPAILAEKASLRPEVVPMQGLRDQPVRCNGQRGRTWHETRVGYSRRSAN